MRPARRGTIGAFVGGNLRDPTAEVLAALDRFGLLLKQDKRLPSVVSLLTGEALSTSWWSHPAAHTIFAVLGELEDHPDVLFTKLLLGKDTLVHRALWPALLTVATAGEPWQARGLSGEARDLWQAVLRAGAPVRASGKPVRELTKRLLVHATEVHTASGRHATALEPWPAWAGRAEVTGLGSPAEAREALEAAARSLGAPPSALPWR